MSANRFSLIRSLLHFTFFIAILLAIPLSTPLPVTAEPNHEFTVDTTADTVDVNPGDGQCADSTGKCSLRAAIQETNALAGADRIILPANIYTFSRAGGGENNAATGDLDIKGVLTIDGTYYDEVPHLRSIIDAGQLDRVFDIKSTANVTMNYLWIEWGKVPNNISDEVGSGGGIYNKGTLLLNGCLVDHNKSGIIDGYYVMDATGGGIYNIGPSLTLINTTIWANSTSNGGNYYTGGNPGGGIASIDGSLTITGGLIWQNTTGNGGDGTDIGFSGGDGGWGGGIYISGGTANLTGVTIQENTTGYGGAGASGQYGGGGGHGGGIAVNSGNLTLTGSSVLNNMTGKGGAGSNVSGWGAGGAGGGIFIVAGSPSMDNTTISGNSTGNGGPGGHGGYGGGIYCAMIPFSATNLTLANNHTGSGAAGGTTGGDGGWGGGLYAYGCSVSINGGTIQGNYTGSGGSGTTTGGSGGYGGGIAHESSGSDSLTNLTISGNSAGNGGSATFAGSGGKGGGIWAGSPSLTRCTVSGNIAGNAGSGSWGYDGSGGGIYSLGEVYVTNSTISGNSTGTGNSNGDGGGVYAGGGTYLRSSTVTNNTASRSGGGVNGATARNSILANNSAPSNPDCGGLYSEGYNLVKDTSGCYIGGDTIGNIIGVDPLLGSLANNGGPTLTHALGSSSQAIDSANPATPGSGGNGCPATDQRGTSRSDLRCDMGAFESPSGGSTTVSRVLDPDQMTVFGATLVSMTLTSNPSIIVTVSKHGQAPTGLPTNLEPIPAYWEITPPTYLNGIANGESAETGYSLNLSLCYTDQEVTGKDKSQLKMWHKSGGIWTKQDSTPDPVHNCVTAAGVTELSTWTLATPLPTCLVRLNNNPSYYPTIQAAVDASTNPNDLVKVAGTCSGVNHYSGLAQTVYLSKTLTIQGGYTTTNWTTPNPIANPTTLDAQGLGRAMVIMGDISPTIAGLRITGGNAEGLDGGLPGADAAGGIGVGNGSPTIRDCEIFNNTADVAGGISMSSDHSILTNNFIHDNHANQAGGGIGTHLSHATLSGNIIQENVSGGNGGGLDLGESEMTLSYNSILTNTSGTSADGGYGGGLSADKTLLTFNHNLVSGNRSIYQPTVDDGGYGGGVYLNQSDASLTGNQITYNQSGWGAGGLAIDYLSSVNLQDNIIAHNDAGEEGGGIGIYLSHPVTFTNNVIADNTAGSAGYGGRGAGGVGAGLSSFGGTSLNLKHNTFARNSGLSGIYVDRSWFWLDWPTSLVMTNTILVSHTIGISVTGGNTVTVNSILWDSYTPVTVTEGVTAVVNLLNQHTGNPAFASDGYHLTAASDAIDIGLLAGVMADVDGQPRPMNAGYDLGADEYPEIIPLSSGSGSVSTPDQLLTFTWSLAQPITLTYASQLTTTNSTGDFNFAGIVFHLEATDQYGNPVIIPASPLTLVLHYDDADLPPGTVESYLKVYRYDSTLHAWVALTVLSRDTVANTLTVQLDHFSDFALLAKQQKKVYLPCILR